MGGALDERRSLVDLRQFERTGAGDVDQNAARAVDGAGLKERRRHSRLRRFNGAILARAHRRAHDRVSHPGHGGLHIGKVAVDDAGNGDDVGDALHPLAKHIVGDAEALKEAGVLGHVQQLLVGNHDHCVHGIEKFLEAAFGLPLAALALEAEGAGDDSDGQNAHLAGQRRDYRRCAGTGAAAQPGGDKDHVRAFQRLDDFFRVFQGREPANVRVGPGAQTGGEPHAELQLDRRMRVLECLHVGVGGDKLHALHPGLDHAVDGVAAAAAHADDLDASAARALFVILNTHCSGFILRLFHFGSGLLIPG